MWFLIYVTFINPAMIIETPRTQLECEQRLEALAEKAIFLSPCLNNKSELQLIINHYLQKGSV